MKYVYTFALCIFLVRNVGCLECYNCHGVMSPSSCQSRRTCEAGQSCYQESRRTSAGTVFDMGCRDTAVCALMDTIIVGRSVEKRQQADCRKCCFADLCNDKFCSFVYPAQVRLTGGVSAAAGRVEISLDNGETWGTICDDSFLNTEAGVVCKMLGYQRQGAIATSQFGTGLTSQKILLDDVDCRGFETNIFNCRHSTVGVNNCDHSEDVGVSCVSTPMSDAQIHLVNGTSPREGRVEVSVDGGATWGTICDDHFNNTEAGVICASLGYERGSALAKLNSYFGGGSKSQVILLDDVYCKGNETNILACQHRPVGESNCAHVEDVGVSCLSATNLRVRLVDGPTSHEGRVEVSDDGGLTWGTVCDDGFGDMEARVVCHMLEYPWAGAVALRNAPYGEGNSTSLILLDDVQCTSADMNIFFCRHNGIGEENCDHNEDVGVQCRPSK
ncbi:neurotrypsin-like [Mya arenaria]|uniref:neurotrypsin-like n=1 Tax=Mya arenaria TaxID=6604 RepID=UPI0022E35BF3|nr:neurotrypsin-like [Mya arenaria]